MGLFKALVDSARYFGKKEQHSNKIFTGEVQKPPLFQELNECVREYGESDERYRDKVLEIINKHYPLERV